mmetsp:Transcript_83/g.351  ORF Transcript_83/g.351 Transcript_83/m.351 type:complete len:316 (-) Transcript_83:141-1088(-)
MYVHAPRTPVAFRRSATYRASAPTTGVPLVPPPLDDGKESRTRWLLRVTRSEGVGSTIGSWASSTSRASSSSSISSTSTICVSRTTVETSGAAVVARTGAAVVTGATVDAAAGARPPSPRGRADASALASVRILDSASTPHAAFIASSSRFITPGRFARANTSTTLSRARSNALTSPPSTHTFSSRNHNAPSSATYGCVNRTFIPAFIAPPLNAPHASYSYATYVRAPSVRRIFRHRAPLPGARHAPSSYRASDGARAFNHSSNCTTCAPRAMAPRVALASAPPRAHALKSLASTAATTVRASADGCAASMASSH